MDIEENQQPNKSQNNNLQYQNNQNVHALNSSNQQRQSIGNNLGLSGNRHSLQGRISNQSYLSFGKMSIQEPNYTQNQKISLESNISLKARQIMQNKDLFQNLANEERNSFTNNLFIRQQGSFKQVQPLAQNIQVHFPLYHLNNNQFNLSSQQYKQRNSQGTHNNPNDQYINVHGNVGYHQNWSSTQKIKIMQPHLSQTKKESHSNFKNQFPEQKVQTIISPITKPPQLKQIICKCPRSKCLLMYCQCFSKGILCNQKCTCYQCRNNPDFQQKRQNARRIVLQRDPNAFSNKLEVVGGQQEAELAYKRGCNCKKTNCFKKYCECFYAGVKCTYLCKCQNCMNGGENAFKG